MPPSPSDALTHLGSAAPVGSGDTTNSVERTTLEPVVPLTSADPVATTTGAVDSTVASAAGMDAVAEYLGLLDAGEYAAAAELLGNGAESSDELLDLSALTDVLDGPGALASALQGWCASGALCAAPADLTSWSATPDGTVEVTTTWGVAGAMASAVFAQLDVDGSPAVRGLPPLVDDEALETRRPTRAGRTRVAGIPDPALRRRLRDRRGDADRSDVVEAGGG